MAQTRLINHSGLLNWIPLGQEPNFYRGLSQNFLIAIPREPGYTELYQARYISRQSAWCHPWNPGGGEYTPIVNPDTHGTEGLYILDIDNLVPPESLFQEYFESNGYYDEDDDYEDDDE